MYHIVRRKKEGGKKHHKKRFSFYAAICRMTGQALQTKPNQKKGNLKPYYKVIITNHVVEVYEIEKEPFKPQDLDKVDEYSEHLRDTRLLAGNPETRKKAVQQLKDDRWDKQLKKIDRKEERRKQTLRDARNRCRRLAIANFNEESLFITLTFAENVQDIDFSDNEFKKFIQRCKYKYGPFDYIAVREFQKRGAIHYHMICNMSLGDVEGFEVLERDFGLNDAVEAEEVKRTGKRNQNHLWGFGWVDIQRLNKTKKEGKNVDNVGAYLTKYMTKDISHFKLKGKKVFLPSRGLLKPVIITGMDAEKFLADFKKRQKKETFTNYYENEYLGKISYTEYNLKR